MPPVNHAITPHTPHAFLTFVYPFDSALNAVSYDVMQYYYYNSSYGEGVRARDLMFAFQVVSNQKLFTFGAALNGILHRILAYFLIKQTNSLFIIFLSASIIL